MAQLDARTIDEQSTARRAQIIGMSYIDTSRIANKQLYNNFLSNSEMYKLRIVPLVSDEHNVTFGITTTTSQQTLNDLRMRFPDQKVGYAIISDNGFRDYMKLYDPPPDVKYQDISLAQAGSKDLIKQVSDTLNQVKADDILAYLVKQAHQLESSDIHLESEREYVRVRFRIDGVLHPVATLSKEKFRTLLSTIAVAGNVSTGINDAQQGHISQTLTMGDGTTVQVNVRLETVPTIHGTDVVMRLFNMDQELYSLDLLGLDQRERSVVDDIIMRPSGLVMVVGPTGSGKTTTLYSMLNSLNSTERKIITIEDPVEYQFEGISQISVNTKGTEEVNFADKLKAILRLDPDVIMVGEIRDMDTAKTALQAALTGHLVLSTFHASSAAAAVTRLMDVIDENPLFASSIRLIMAQRLVRRLDDTLKQPYTPDQVILEWLQKVVDSLPPGIEKPSLDNLKLYHPGKSDENPYGYRSQVALREQFIMTPGLMQLLTQPSKTLTAQHIEEEAVKNGMKTMLQDGVLKAIAGITTLEEINRVIG